MLNAHIGQLGKLIPIAMMSTRKMDKSSVLRLAVNHLRVDGKNNILIYKTTLHVCAYIIKEGIL